MAEDTDTGDAGDAIPRFADAPAGAVLGAVANTASAIGTVWIGALMALIVADVIGRNFLNAPITGVSEIAGRSVVAIVFLQIAAAVMQGRLTRADFLIRRIQRAAPASARLLETLFAIIGTLVFAAIVWASWPKMAGAWTTSEFFGVQGVFTIPTFPFRAITVAGAALAMLACIYQLARILRGPRSDAS